VEASFRSDRVDLLLVVDNSQSMADTQQVLSAAVPDLIAQLVNPPCADAAGRRFVERTPEDPSEPCPAPLARAFEPIVDMHVGVISSSLGDFGATNTPCITESSRDMSHLIGSLPRGLSEVGASPFFQPAGFLRFDAENSSAQDLANFQNAVQRLIVAVGQDGCGFESTHEAWYRFLIDETPYLALSRVACTGDTSGRTDCVQPTGIDSTIVQQRAQFVRPGSLVAVVVLSDENDCSFRVGGQAWFAADNGQTTRMFRGAAVCATDPNSPCCYSCGTTPPQGCAADPACSMQFLSDEEDPVNLRCAQQQRRFGIDFLYPIRRYVNALTEPELCLERADRGHDDGCAAPVPNPLFTDPSRVELRHPAKVYLGTIVGAPWQDLAASLDASGALLPQDELHFMNGPSLLAADRFRLVTEEGTRLPLDPLMWESVAPRSGQHPLIQEALAPPSAGPLENSINGHEWPISTQDSLQYACIFPLESPYECSDGDGPCDCAPGGAGHDFRPLCQDPVSGAYGTTQFFAKAFPGLRHLAVAEGVAHKSGNVLPASICARNTSDTSRQDFGYRPFTESLLRQMSPVLGGARR
jgi:hypothetical protein